MTIRDLLGKLDVPRLLAGAIRTGLEAWQPGLLDSEVTFRLDRAAETVTLRVAGTAMGTWTWAELEAYGEGVGERKSGTVAGSGSAGPVDLAGKMPV